MASVTEVYFKLLHMFTFFQLGKNIDNEKCNKQTRLRAGSPVELFFVSERIRLNINSPVSLHCIDSCAV